MSEKKNSNLWSADTALLIAALIVCLVVGGIAISNRQSNRQERLMAAQVKLENSTSKLLKAILNVYYVNYSKYPSSYDVLSEDARVHPELYDQGEAETTLGQLEDEIPNDLKNLKYEVRGDGQAYKFTYTSANNDQQLMVKGEYQEEYR